MSLARRLDPATAERAGRALGLLVAALTLFHLGVLAYHVAQLIRFPYDVNYGEGYVLNDALRLARGEPIYVSMEQFPMVRSPYPPLVPALLGVFTLAAGPAFWPGRLLAATCVAAILGLLAWNAVRARAGWLAAVAAAGGVAASPYVYDWAGYVRVDFPAILLAVAAVLAAQWVGGWRGVLLAAVLSGLAVWSKQTAVSAPAAITLAYLLARRYRHAAAFVLVQVIPSFVLLLLLETGSGGQFSRHVLFGNALNPYSPPRAIGWLALFLLAQWPLVLAAAWWLSRGLTRAPSPIALYVLFALATTLSVGNQGSAENYLLEGIVAGGLAVPFAWRALAGAARLLAPAMAAVQLVLTLHLPNGPLLATSGVPVHATPTAADYVNAARVDAAVRDEPRAVLSEMAGFSLRNGRPVFVQPIDLRAEEYHGRWNSAPLLDAMRSGTFGLVVETYRLLPFGAERVLRSDFELVEQIPAMNGFTHRLYRPRTPS